MQYGSVYNLFKRPGMSAIGQRMLKRWVRQPLVKLSEIQERHDLVGLLGAW